MSKTPEAKAACAVRREQRVRRDKTAAILMAPLLLEAIRFHLRILDQKTFADEMDDIPIIWAAKIATDAADMLLETLDETHAIAEKESS